MRGRRVVVGIAGGIAAYKGAELVRLLVKEGAAVQVVLTPAATEFVTKLTLQTLSGRPVASELFDLDDESRIGHIRIADEADLVVVAPATADLIARMAAGMANDLLSTVLLATRAPVLLAPAMNVNMWSHAATQQNLATLVGRGVRTVGPDRGELACGWVGSGRLVEPQEILAACRTILVDAAPQHILSDTNTERRDLDGVALLVTAGPTCEDVDPVRYLANRSSGKMGFALARRAAARGARVVLVAGPVALATPDGVERVDVRSAVEMDAAVRAREGEVRAVVMAAAVADWRPARPSDKKMKKGPSDTMTLVLEKNPDILAGLGARRKARGGKAPVLVGFAAETGDLEVEAHAKLAKKGCDLLVANDVAEPGSGFAVDTNRVVLLRPGEAPVRLPQLPKDDVADRILDAMAPLLDG